MTQAAWLLLALAAAVAVFDWLNLVHRRSRLRVISKPGVMVLLIAVALALHPRQPLMRDIFAGGLFLSGVGDTLLLADLFLPGLAAFGGAHLAYIDGFLGGGVRWDLLAYSAPAVALVSLAVGGRILAAVAAKSGWTLGVPVLAYLLAISAMVALAIAGGRPLAGLGAVLFYASDGLIAWRRFVRPLAWAELPIMVTYHLGQAALVVSLAT